MNNYSFMMSAFGLLFFIIGAVMTIIAVRLIIAAKNGRKVTAEIVDVITSRRKVRRRRGGSSMRTFYTPVYEYYDGGEVKTYQSKVSTTMQITVGKEETLYISENGEIIEKVSCYLYLLVGIVFAAVGAFLLFGAGDVIMR